MITFFQPDNFPYFLTLFSLGIIGGTYLLFTYYVNRLLIMNAIVLFLAALRVASEYYLQQLGAHSEVASYAPLHILPINILLPMQWSMLIFYIRPLKGIKWEGVANWFFVIGLVIIPFAFINYYTSINPKIFYFLPEQIDGYWQFSVNRNFWFAPYYYGYVNTQFFLLPLMLIMGVIRNPKNRILQSLLVFSYFLSFWAYSKFVDIDQLNVPNQGILFLSHSLIISWYVSNYRLFRSNVALMTRELFESISDLTISTDPKLKITNVNSKAASVLSSQTTNVISLLEQFNSLPEQDVTTGIHQLINRQIDQLDLELNDQHGQQRFFSLKVAPFTDGEKVLSYTFLLTDLTSIRERERQLSALNATKDRLFAIIGHDLRRPALAFRGIGAKLQYLIQKQDEKRLLKFGHELEKEAFSLNSLLDNLLNWALRERGVLPFNPQLLVPQQEVLKVFELFEDVAAQKKIALNVTIKDETRLWTDPNTFKTIVRNLVDNAIKFTLSGGKVTVSDETSDTHLIISISDTGIGIPPDDLNSLFSLEGKRSRPGTEGEKGTGLGVHLVNELVRLNHGNVSVESQEGKGTTFRIAFPLGRREG